MKASRFVKPFEQQVDFWERALSKITETTEMLLVVQRQWLYMETIFLGEDIRKQLPKESTMFDDVNIKWRVIMTKMNELRNAKRCSEEDGTPTFQIIFRIASAMEVHYPLLSFFQQEFMPN